MSIFSQIPKPKLKRNTFNLSHDVKLTTEFGRLTPIFCEPVIPGDTWKLNSEIIVKVAPLLAPVMHRVNIYTHFYFVPSRLIWSNWQKFITGGETGTEEIVYPKLKIVDLENKPASVDSYVNDYLTPLLGVRSLADYLGFPSVGTTSEDLDDFKSMLVDALPFRAYQLIFNEYYRDQNLQDEIEIAKDVDGVIDDYDYLKDMMTLRYRAMEKDYFTSALPWTQRGAETTIGLTGNADVILDSDSTNKLHTRIAATGEIISDSNQYGMRIDRVGIAPTANSININSGGNSVPIQIDPNHTLKADLSTVNATTINELRRAIQLQQYKEALARCGSRYTELIRGLFGVISSDARLQRPEFLGGGKTQLAFGEVLQTSQTSDSSPLANYAGRGVAYGRGHSFKKFFEEHGYIIGIMSIMPKPGYMQGLPRKYYKFDRLDHYIPQFANIGEQPILEQEIFYQFTDSEEHVKNSDTFGYTPRYAEYKYLPNRVHGDFKDTLEFWHMARDFEYAPLLNESFIQCDPQEYSRVFNVTETGQEYVDNLWCMLYLDVKATRPMPKFGVPLI